MSEMTLDVAVHTITLCGSTKFKHYFIYANEILTMRGSVVISLAFFGHADKINLTREQKEFLDELHLKKIMKADEIFVLDVNGYVGDSTRKEIEFAEAHNKIITYYTQCEELRLEIDNKVREYLDAFDADAERVRRKKQREVLADLMGCIDAVLMILRIHPARHEFRTVVEDLTANRDIYLATIEEG